MDAADLNTVSRQPARQPVPFEALRPRYPLERLRLERADGDLSVRLLDLVAPIGKGQRCLIVSPPKAGKTILLQKMAISIVENAPGVRVMVLLIDERPEEVTDMREKVNAEVIASTFDESPEHHIRVAEGVFNRARGLVEQGKDVAILLDSITRLARAYNSALPDSGRTLTGGVDATALHQPKRAFGSARNIVGGGSLTVIATALIETGSRMDEVIFEEFKGTGNSEIVLDREVAERRIFPAVNIHGSGTRKEELLLSETELNRMALLRRFIADMDAVAAIQFVTGQLRQTDDNRAFFRAMATGL
ncbi:MAG: transcription termination factor Rho [Gemmatimonadetes bacterium]|nr:transcription termination factor Rho [Gemmatimonadota bacterium]